MQNVSKDYKSSMKEIYRNRGYIRISIGVINSQAQKNISADDPNNNLTYFSDTKKIFNGYSVNNVYATAEENFSKVDGSMFFLPADMTYQFYNNGLVSNEILGAVYINFSGITDLDIKGLTIDFGEFYPVDFSIENDLGVHNFTGNNKRYFTTEDVFNGTSYFIIRPKKMVNGQGRLRIYQFSCGIANIFTNNECIDYSSQEYVSAISETIPSQDVSFTVNNRNLYYSPDNPDSMLTYMEMGQEVKTAFGYDVLGDGVIEWLPEQVSYLKTWEANDKEATFTATDRFDNMTGSYYRGKFRQEGISLYDLAIDVLYDAGIVESNDYYLDTYLKEVVVYNPMPVVSHSSALQIIANAGRCSLSEDRSGRIHIQSSFIPDMVATANDQTEYSHVENIIEDNEKDAYAVTSRDFTVIDGSLFFMPADKNYLDTGYISESIADENGDFINNPKITIQLEASYIPYGLSIQFRNIAPKEFHIITYNNKAKVSDFVVSEPDIVYSNTEQFTLFDKMELVFTKGYPNSRVFVDHVIFGDTTDYMIAETELAEPPVATRQNKIKSISVSRNVYKNSAELKDLASEDILIPNNLYEHTVYFSKPSCGYIATVSDNSSVTVNIVESSSYFVKLRFEGIKSEMVVSYVVTGYEYTVDEQKFTVIHNKNGEEKAWNNPLVSEVQHAKNLEEWLASYFLGDMEYQITWRGDPRVDANDLFHLKTRVGIVTVRDYDNSLNFNGGWNGSMKARKVVL